jgi:hypothetical protein
MFSLYYKLFYRKPHSTLYSIGPFQRPGDIKDNDAKVYNFSNSLLIINTYLARLLAEGYASFCFYITAGIHYSFWSVKTMWTVNPSFQLQCSYYPNTKYSSMHSDQQMQNFSSLHVLQSCFFQRDLHLYVESSPHMRQQE